MLAGLLAALGGLRTYLLAGLAVAVATVIGVLWLQLHDAKAQVTALQLNNERLSQQVLAQDVVIAAKADAIEELERTNAEQAKQAAELAQTLQEIRNAPAIENGPIAPVLDRALKRIGGGVRK